MPAATILVVDDEPLIRLSLCERLTAEGYRVLESGTVAGIDLEQLERSLVIQALDRSGWNQTRAAALLGLNRDQIRYRIEKFKLEPSVTT